MKENDKGVDVLVSGNMLAVNGFIWAGKGTMITKGQGTIRAGQDFYFRLILWLILRYKDIIRMSPSSFIKTIHQSPDLMFVQEIKRIIASLNVYLK